MESRVPCWPFSPGDVVEVSTHSPTGEAGPWPNMRHVARVRRAAGPERLDKKTGKRLAPSGWLHLHLSVERHFRPEGS